MKQTQFSLSPNQNVFNMKNILIPQHSAELLCYPIRSKISVLDRGRGISPQIQRSWQNWLLGALKTLAILSILLILPTRIPAQLPCNGAMTSCVAYPQEPETYKCLEGIVFLSTIIIPQNQVLLSAQDAESNAQRIVIKGILIVDVPTSSGGYTFSENSEIVFVENTTGLSGINVHPGCKLTLDKVFVHGCNTMWQNIAVNNNATLIVKNHCRIEDGYAAIRASANAIVSITDSDFAANHIAMEFHGGSNGPISPIQFTPDGGIWGNIIDGSSELKEPYLGDKPYQGIYTYYTSLTIGDWSHAANVIQNFDSESITYGMAFQFSTITLKNFTIIGIKNPNAAGSNAGIQASNSKLTIFGSPSLNLIRNCDHGIQVYSSDLKMDKTRIEDVFNGVHIITDQAIQSIDIYDCEFVEFTRAIDNYQYWHINLSKFRVEECLFIDNSLESMAGYVRMGINMSSNFPIDGNNIEIINNDMYSKDRGTIFGSFWFTGIGLSNVYKGNIQGNKFYDLNVMPTTSHIRVFTGIGLDGCNKVQCFDNDFIGVTDPVTSNFYKDVGVSAMNSPFIYYGCNYFDNLEREMIFSGSCNSSTLYHNSLNNYEIGLMLDKGAVIGGQRKKYNSWNGPADFADAYMFFENYNPVLDASQVKKSEFIIHTANQNTAAWADPRLVGSVLGNDPNWFVGPTEPPTWPPPLYLCPVETLDPDDPKYDYAEKGIINGTFIPWKGYTANTWDATFLLYQRMTEDVTLRPDGSSEAAWYANNLNGNIGKFRRVFDGFVSLSSNVPTTTATQLLADLNAITVTTTHEQNLKTDLLIFLDQYISNGTSLSPQQTADLTVIADQCRYEGGIGVVLARLALGQPSIREGDCPEVPEREPRSDLSSQISTNIAIVTVFPNPAPEQAFRVQLDQSIHEGTLRLVDLQGRVVGTWIFSGSAVDIHEVNVNPGAYLLELLEQGHVLSRNKLVFSR